MGELWWKERRWSAASEREAAGGRPICAPATQDGSCGSRLIFIQLLRCTSGSTHAGRARWAKLRLSFLSFWAPSRLSLSNKHPHLHLNATSGAETKSFPVHRERRRVATMEPAAESACFLSAVTRLRGNVRRRRRFSLPHLLLPTCRALLQNSSSRKKKREANGSEKREESVLGRGRVRGVSKPKPGGSR